MQKVLVEASVSVLHRFERKNNNHQVEPLVYFCHLLSLVWQVNLHFELFIPGISVLLTLLWYWK